MARAPLTWVAGDRPIGLPMGRSGNKRRIGNVAPRNRQEDGMLKGGLLWLVGIPVPLILLAWFFGYL